MPSWLAPRLLTMIRSASLGGIRKHRDGPPLLDTSGHEDLRRDLVSQLSSAKTSNDQHGPLGSRSQILRQPGSRGRSKASRSTVQPRVVVAFAAAHTDSVLCRLRVIHTNDDPVGRDPVTALLLQHTADAWLMHRAQRLPGRSLRPWAATDPFGRLAGK